MTGVSRRRFLQASAATAAALTLGPTRWGWSTDDSPFGPLQDDPMLRLREGFSYKVIAETGEPLRQGRGPATRPQFPDLNVAFRQPDGKILLSTSHEIPPEFPISQPPPQEEYDRLGTGAITSLLLNPDLTIADSAYNAGGMMTNCSGGKTPWGTVLTGEESTIEMEADHGFIWEVDPHKHTKVRLDACGRFEHEAAIVDGKTGYVYLTEDSGEDSLLYRMRPERSGELARGGILEAYRLPDGWVRIDDPLGTDENALSAQGIARGALKFARLEGTRRRGRWLYFTETGDDTTCGKVWRLHLDTNKLELWAQGSENGKMCMPDNLVFDAAGNMFVLEDKDEASSDNPNHIWFIDRETGKMRLFGQLVVERQPFPDEPTGPVFDPSKQVLFLNLQRAGEGGGRTLAITGPFAKRRRGSSHAAANVAPAAARASEATALEHDPALLARLGMSLGAGSALVSLRRRGRIDRLHPALEEVAVELGAPAAVANPRRRPPKVF